MKIIQPSAKILSPDLGSQASVDAIYKIIEIAGRTCYKSEENTTPESARKFVAGLVRRGHEAMIEHAHMTVRFIVDRGVSHELVRHRLASWAQESQRYCAYNKAKFGGEITFIKPCYFAEDSEAYVEWKKTMLEAEETYLEMLANGVPPEQARSVLPNSTKTEVIMTANMREWRHFMKLRAAGETGRPHPQMLEVTVPLLKQCREYMPEIFGDIEPLE